MILTLPGLPPIAVDPVAGIIAKIELAGNERMPPIHLEIVGGTLGVHKSDFHKSGSGGLSLHLFGAEAP